MPTRTQAQIDVIVENARANFFSRMMVYGRNLNLDVAQAPELSHQSNLIFGASSEYATLDQKNKFCDELNRLSYTTTFQDGLGTLNLFTSTL